MNVISLSARDISNIVEIASSLYRRFGDQISCDEDFCAHYHECDEHGTCWYEEMAVRYGLDTEH